MAANGHDNSDIVNRDPLVFRSHAPSRHPLIISFSCFSRFALSAGGRPRSLPKISVYLRLILV